MPYTDIQKVLRMAEGTLDPAEFAEFKYLMNLHGETLDPKDRAMIELQLMPLLDKIINGLTHISA